MEMNIKIDSTEIKAALEQLRGVPNQFVERVLARAASATRALAPVASGQLASSGRHRMTGPNTGELIYDTNYSTFSHFGTEPIRAGNGGEFLNAIKDWARVKGLPEAAAFPIARSIAKKGVTPNPWLQDYLESDKFQRMAIAVAEKEVQRAVA